MKGDITRVFLTGATGVMGMAGLQELMRSPEGYNITVLARPSKKNKKKLRDFEKKGVKVIWGDLLDEDSLREGIEGCDIVLHVGGMVSPQAEYYPERTLRVNVGSMKLISKIVKEIETREPDRAIKVVYIGSVSQYGSKLPPRHWGKAGDRQISAKMDAYAVSKILAERSLIEAGLKRWVSIRQTAILHSGLLKNADNPVTFHVPMKGVLEWITTEDSGRLLERICRKDLPDTFWNHCYNAGGGEAFRLTNIEFERGILKALGCRPPEKIFEPNWFATDNFHGIWFEDSDYLDSFLHYREADTFESALRRMSQQIPFYYKLSFLAPTFLIKSMMRRVAQRPVLGPLWWIKTSDEERIKSAWGSIEGYKKIPTWKEFKEARLDKKTPGPTSPRKLNNDVLEKTRCSRGHEYPTSEALVAEGHDCPFCLLEDAKVECREF